MFTLFKQDQNSQARRGLLQTAHGQIETPFFMPVGTNGTVKSLTFEDLHEIESPIVLCNAYHLYLRPGLDLIRQCGGLHAFIGWNKPILTDSGGYQVFSLTKFRKLHQDGVVFQSHLDGSKHSFTPEKVIDIERTLGSDIIMPLDVCAPYPCDYQQARRAVEWTTSWAHRCKDHFIQNKNHSHEQILFGIIQGATYQDLRERSAQEIVRLGFDGYAIGGVSVGEPIEEMFKALKHVLPFLPTTHPRYFMGIGLPDQIVQAVGQGVDMFDTCIPTRYGRHGTAFTNQGPINLNHSDFVSDLSPLDETSECELSNKYSRAYLRHLLKSHEISGLKIISYHNIHFYVNLMKKIRQAIDEDRYSDFQEKFLKKYNSELFQAV